MKRLLIITAILLSTGIAHAQQLYGVDGLFLCVSGTVRDAVITRLSNHTQNIVKERYVLVYSYEQSTGTVYAVSFHVLLSLSNRDGLRDDIYDYLQSNEHRFFVGSFVRAWKSAHIATPGYCGDDEELIFIWRKQ